MSRERGARGPAIQRDALEAEAKRIVLARRARFVSAALVGIAGCASSAERHAAPPRHDDLVIPPIPMAAAHNAHTVDAAAPSPMLDTDGDGIADDEDACPSEAGVDSQDAKTRGCPSVRLSIIVPSTIAIVPRGRIGFAPHGTQPGPMSAASLDETANVMKLNPQWNLEIEGHTDTLEPSPLGQIRADAVRSELVKRGVAANRITTRNAGPNKPLSTNVTVAGRAQNRRVELTVPP